MESKDIPIGRKYQDSPIAPRNGLLREMLHRDARPFSDKEGVPFERHMIGPALNLAAKITGPYSNVYKDILPLINDFYFGEAFASLPNSPFQKEVKGSGWTSFIRATPDELYTKSEFSKTGEAVEVNYAGKAEVATSVINGENRKKLMPGQCKITLKQIGKDGKSRKAIVNLILSEDHYSAMVVSTDGYVLPNGIILDTGPDGVQKSYRNIGGQVIAHKAEESLPEGVMGDQL